VFGGDTLPGRAQHHAEHLPAQGLGGGAGRARVRGEEARELIGGASHQVQRRAVKEHDGEDAVAGGNGEEQAVHAGGRRGGLPAGEAGSGQAREREMAEWAGEVGEVGGVGRHDSAERRRPRRSRTAAGAAADEGHLRFVQPRLKSPRRVSFCGPLVPAVTVGSFLCVFFYFDSFNFFSQTPEKTIFLFGFKDMVPSRLAPYVDRRT
jgi:hypothetical protein